MIKISVIVPSYNVEHVAQKVIESLLNQTYPLEDYEIIWIDDCSQDNTFKIIQKAIDLNKNKNARLFKNDINKGRNWCRNYGVELSKGELLVFIDSDNIVDKNLISSYGFLLAQENTVGIGNVAIRNKKYLNKFAQYWNCRSPENLVNKRMLDKENMPSKMLCTANCAIRKKSVLNIGCLPLELHQADDDYLGILLKSIGSTFVFVGGAKSDHQDPTFTIKGYIIKFYNQGKEYRLIFDTMNSDIISGSFFKYLLPPDKNSDSIKDKWIKLLLSYLMDSPFISPLFLYIHKKENANNAFVPYIFYRIVLAYAFFCGYRNIKLKKKITNVLPVDKIP